MASALCSASYRRSLRTANDSPQIETLMIPWILLDSTAVPGNGGELRLSQRVDEFSIKIVGRSELMNSRVHGSETALAEHTDKWCQSTINPNIQNVL